MNRVHKFHCKCMQKSVFEVPVLVLGQIFIKIHRGPLMLCGKYTEVFKERVLKVCSRYELIMFRAGFVKGCFLWKVVAFQVLFWGRIRYVSKIFHSVTIGFEHCCMIIYRKQAFYTFEAEVL